MRPKTVRALRYKIRTVGYCHRRMRYFHTKAVILERLVASKNLPIDYSESLEKMLRYQKKADWYRKRDDDLLPIEDQEQVVELDLTEGRLIKLATVQGIMFNSLVPQKEGTPFKPAPKY